MEDFPTTDRRQRPDRRRDATRIALLETAERLFADGGLRPVSIRQIGSAVGSLNAGIVGYYFGNIKNLVESIFDYRLEIIDRRRSELLAELLLDNSTFTLIDLLRVFSLPLFEQCDADGRPNFARIVTRLHREDIFMLCTFGSDQYTSTREISSMIIEMSGPAHTNNPIIRFRLASHFILTYLALMNNSIKRDDHNFDTALNEILIAAGIIVNSTQPLQSDNIDTIVL